MQRTLVIFLLLLATSNLMASLDSCYQVVEVISGTGLAGGDSVTFDFENSTAWVNGTTLNLNDVETYQTGNKKSLINHFDCIYSFDRFEDLGIFTASTMELESIGQLIVVTHHESNEAYLMIGSGVFLVVTCGESSDCITPRYRQAIVADVDYSLVAIPEGAEYSITPPILETVTEQVLVQDAYSIGTVIPAQFETISEQRASVYTNICPEYNAIPIQIEEEVLVKEGYSTLRINPAEFELVTEQVLASDGYIDVEILSIDDLTEQYAIETHQEYNRYSWQSIGFTCLSNSPYDCVEVLTEQVPGQNATIEHPSTWNCSEDIDWSDEVLLVSEISATYLLRSLFRLRVPWTTESTEFPTETKIRTYSGIENINEIPDTCIQITYEEDTYLRLAYPATTMSQEVPAIYESRQYVKQVINGTYEIDQQQTTCNLTLEGNKVVKPAEINYAEYLCMIDDVERQEAIKQSLHSLGILSSINVPFASGDFWLGLFDFQSGRDKWDIGPMTESQAQFLDRP